jgi:hypothetical protein
MVREWRHLKMLKRSGRGHDPAGISSTKAGQCAVLCPACPQPGINLPEGWAHAPEEKRYSRSNPNCAIRTKSLHFSWVYSLFLAIDANFRLKRKAVSNDKIDPGLSQGWSYFVQETAFKAHLREHGDQKQDVSTAYVGSSIHLNDVYIKPSTCSSHNAVNNANIASHHGLSATGVGAVDCARHDIKRPCSVGDLQKGERSAL